MLVSTLITQALNLADVQNTSFYTPAEALFAVQLSWEQIYSLLCMNNDDYFVTQIYLGMSENVSVSPDSKRQFVSLIDTTNLVDFPDGFFRLRLIQYQGMASGAQYQPVQKMTIENFGNTQNTPAYRFEGKNIAIYDPANYSNYCLWYYPRPVTLTTSTDLSYPYNMIPELMAYQIAVEVRRKQKADFEPWQQRVSQITNTMLVQMSRDDSHGEPIKNNFGQGFAPYI
jgi:hypothetical protein